MPSHGCRAAGTLRTCAGLDSGPGDCRSKRGATIPVTDCGHRALGVLHTDLLVDATGGRVQLPHSWGFLMGAVDQATHTDFPTALGGTPNGSAYNLTTVRYPPSASSVTAELTDGVTRNVGYNIPLNSAHPGGTNVLVTDGSVHFISANIDMDTLRFLATRDDGRVSGEF